MRQSFLRSFWALPLLLLGGCQTGWIYTNVTTPLVTNMRSTPSGVRQVDSDLKHLRLPYVEILWDSNAIGDAAKSANLKTIYYADLHNFSLLGGLWQQQYVIVIGE